MAGRRMGVALAAAALLLLAGGSAVAPAAPGLEPPRAAALEPAPGIPPPGANDFSCEGGPGHRIPVVLVHGTFADMAISWNRISPALVRAGYCTFALDLPRLATVRIQRSAEKVSDFIGRVRRATDSRRVSIVGHSQGGMLPRFYIKRLDGMGKVRDLIGLSPSNHGTTTPLAPPAGQIFNCQACLQQVRGSDFLRSLNRGDETPGRRIDYTVVQTRYDEVVTPYTSAFLGDGGPGQVTNVLLQDRCPALLTDHLGIIYNRVALQWIKNALARRGPASRDFQPNC